MQLDDDDAVPSTAGPPARQQTTASHQTISPAQRPNVVRTPQVPDVVGTVHDFSSWNDRSLRNTDEDQQMAIQFSFWFYQRLNSSALAASDFFSDAFLLLCVVGANGLRPTERFEGSELVVGRLRAFVIDEHIIFNPNSTPEGVRGASDPHGRRVVFVCGTVHRGDTVIGLFEQQFGLVRDPTAENNWKVRWTRLALSTSAPALKPTLAMTQWMLTAS